jgi:hypothetical protein
VALGAAPEGKEFPLPHPASETSRKFGRSVRLAWLGDSAMASDGDAIGSCAAGAPLDRMGAFLAELPFTTATLDVSVPVHSEEMENVTSTPMRMDHHHHRGACSGVGSTASSRLSLPSPPHGGKLSYGQGASSVGNIFSTGIIAHQSTSKQKEAEEQHQQRADREEIATTAGFGARLGRPREAGPPFFTSASSAGSLSGSAAYGELRRNQRGTETLRPCLQQSPGGKALIDSECQKLCSDPAERWLDEWLCDLDSDVDELPGNVRL